MGKLMYWDRFYVSYVMIVTYRRINRRKEELCKREGIDHRCRAEFRDMGDASPLFRCVFFLLLLALFSLDITGGYHQIRRLCL